MTSKNPLCIYNGRIRELIAGDTLNISGVEPATVKLSIPNEENLSTAFRDVSQSPHIIRPYGGIRHEADIHRPGKNTSIRCNGESGFLRIDDREDIRFSANWRLSFYVFLTYTPYSWVVMCGKTDWSWAAGWCLYYDDGSWSEEVDAGWYWQLWITNNFHFLRGVIPVGEWVFVELVLADWKPRFYINGILQSFYDGMASEYIPNFSLGFGATPDGNNYCECYMDEIRLEQF